MADVVPFLKAVASAASKPLQDTLPRIPSAPVTSPWTPRATPAEPPPAPAAPSPPPVDVAAITAQAIEDGRAEGLRETEALRAKLIQLIDQLEQAHGAVVAPAAELIADAAVTVIEGWVGATGREALFRPVVQAWLTTGSAAATARCHPSDGEVVRAAIGEAAIKVVEDPNIAPGDLAITDGTRELAQAWEPRLRELRDEIAGVLAEP